jgi:wyosine [tRNA(Phe)-imidazoG37] synthetase (radical SAM superfamily)
VGNNTRVFYPPDHLGEEVRKHLAQLREDKTQVDYLTFVPDGEPSLDAHLNEILQRLRPRQSVDHVGLWCSAQMHCKKAKRAAPKGR